MQGMSRKTGYPMGGAGHGVAGSSVAERGEAGCGGAKRGEARLGGPRWDGGGAERCAHDLSYSTPSTENDRPGHFCGHTNILNPT